MTIAKSLVVCALSGIALIGAGADSRLADAAKAQDRATIRTLLEKHADVNAPQVDGTTAVDWAVRNDDIETATLLIHAGAAVKTANRYGVIPLALACTNGNGAMVALLLKAGADPNSSLPGGESVLMTASRTGRVAAVKALIAAGAQVNYKEPKRGQTPLMWAAAEGNVDAVKTLLAAGAELNAHLESGYTPLLFAVREGRIETVRALLDAGADVNETTHPAKRGGSGPKSGTSPLILATLNGHFELAAYLLDRGANPNESGPGYTALHVISIVRKPGGGDNDPAPDGSGNLTSLQLVKKLVEHKADINARMTKKVNLGLTSLNTLGATPFLMAARSADAELMRYLASLGADPLIPTADNATPLIAAAGLGTRSPGEDAGTESEVVEAMQVCLDLGNNIDAVDKNGETAMHGAAYKNLPGAVLFLAAHGADIKIWNRENSHGWTPLTIAEGYRFGNYKPSPTTVAALHQAMKAAGVPIPVITAPPSSH